MSLSDEQEKYLLLSRLSAVSDQVFTTTIKYYVENLNKLVETSSAKLYYELINYVDNSDMMAVEKDYIKGELTHWGHTLVFDITYVSATNIIIEIWNTIETNDSTAFKNKVKEAVAKCNTVKVTESRYYSYTLLIEAIKKGNDKFGTNYSLDTSKGTAELKGADDDLLGNNTSNTTPATSTGDNSTVPASNGTSSTTPTSNSGNGTNSTPSANSNGSSTSPTSSNSGNSSSTPATDSNNSSTPTANTGNSASPTSTNSGDSSNPTTTTNSNDSNSTPTTNGNTANTTPTTSSNNSSTPSATTDNSTSPSSTNSGDSSNPTTGSSSTTPSNSGSNSTPTTSTNSSSSPSTNSGSNTSSTPSSTNGTSSLPKTTGTMEGLGNVSNPVASYATTGEKNDLGQYVYKYSDTKMTINTSMNGGLGAPQGGTTSLKDNDKFVKAMFCNDSYKAQGLFSEDEDTRISTVKEFIADSPEYFPRNYMTRETYKEIADYIYTKVAVYNANKSFNGDINAYCKAAFESSDFQGVLYTKVLNWIKIVLYKHELTKVQSGMEYGQTSSSNVITIDLRNKSGVIDLNKYLLGTDNPLCDGSNFDCLIDSTIVSQAKLSSSTIYSVNYNKTSNKSATHNEWKLDLSKASYNEVKFSVSKNLSFSNGLPYSGSYSFTQTVRILVK
jgi:hypothetical protein